jgi:carbonic anhydrase
MPGAEQAQNDDAAPAPAAGDHAPAEAGGSSRRGFMRSVAVVGGGLALGAGVGRMTAATAGASARPKTAREIADALLEGNRRFAAGASQHPHLGADVRAAQAEKQTPFAAILSCADSRVSPELVFDQGVGDLFVVRVAGNIASPDTVASLAYAVEHLRVTFIMVLGHESCGAVKATVESVESGKGAGELAVLVDAIAPAVHRVAEEGKQGAEGLAAAVEANARMVASALPRSSPAMQEAMEHRKLTIQAATYGVRTSLVTPLTVVV